MGYLSRHEFDSQDRHYQFIDRSKVPQVKLLPVLPVKEYFGPHLKDNARKFLPELA